MLLIDKLRSKENLTTTEKKIVNYILDNLDEIPAMSVEQLAKKSFSSHSAIVRLSKKLGFAGYKEFRLELSKTIQARIFQPEDVDANFPFKREDDSMMIAKKLADLSVSTIKRSYAQLNKEQLDKAGRMLWSAERIFLFGQGDSQIRARSFQNKLVKIDKFAMIGEEYADEDWVAVNLSPKDCDVFISYGGKSKQSQKIIKFFSQKKVPTLLISGNINSPMIDFADLSIIVKQEEFDFLKVSTFSSQITFEYLLDSLFSIVFAHQYQHNLQRLKTNRALLDNGLLDEKHSLE